MCRLLWTRAHAPFDPTTHLNNFAGIARNSSEYQGHGWGCAWLEGDTWQVYRDIRPIWEDNLGQFGQTTLFLAHARSAFRDEGVVVENNMPFFDGEQMFIFNGELQGVRIKETGRIGAEKVFNYLAVAVSIEDPGTLVLIMGYPDKETAEFADKVSRAGYVVVLVELILIVIAERAAY